MIQKPPIQGLTLTPLGRFVQTWILWFQALKNTINDILVNVDSLFTRVEELEQIFGWAYYDDSQYTSASPLVINNTTTQITIDGLGTSNELSFLPAGVSFFNTSTGRITPQQLGDSFVVRLDFKAKASVNSTSFDLKVDIGSGSPNLVYNQTISVVKAINTEQRYSQSIPLYCLATFVSNGGKIEITTNNNVSFYDFGLFITRVSNPL